MKQQPELDLQELSFLVVDADQRSSRLTRTVLRGFSVRRYVFATNKNDGLQLMKANRPDVLIAEWKLTDETGIDLVREVRSSSFESFQRVPIIMLTAVSELANVIEARDAGVNEFLAKPFSVATLYGRICSLILRPRTFIETDGFIGPDRRRRTNVKFSGPDRRNADSNNEWFERPQQTGRGAGNARELPLSK